ncbi:unnamed protein product, partial [Amoebophrya sp. A25]
MKSHTKLHIKKMASIEWRDVVFSARDPETREATDILCGLSGGVAAGGTLAILGPSGSGKSSLLKVLAGQIRVGSAASGTMGGSAPGERAATGSSPETLKGSVVINGERPAIPLATYAYSSAVKLVSLIEQQDLFIGEVTVQEHLNFYANLRLSHMTRERRKLRIA